MNILGINAFHGDASAALVRDGQLVAAAEEERFLRVKHWAGFPAQAIRYCLEAGGLEPQDLSHVAVSFNPRANLGRKLLFAMRRRPELKSLLDRARRLGKSATLKNQLADALRTSPGTLDKTEFLAVEHHRAHLASAFLCSPFDEAALLSIDGMGDFASVMAASGSGGKIKPLWRVHYPHSLGYLYTAVTMHLGFPKYGDEYKVMGLAPYGEPVYLEEFRKLIRPTSGGFELELEYFEHPRRGIAMSWEGGEPSVEPFHSPKMDALLGGPQRRPDEPLEKRHEDIAASLQAVAEEIIFHLLELLRAQRPSANLCLAGGCAMNSSANGKILSRTPFERLFIPAGAADNGTAFGAAFHVWSELLKRERRFVLDRADWGPDVSAKECLACLKAKERQVTWRELGDDAMAEEVAQGLVDGKIIGWFRGRMEFGARALGNRSLLADPRRTDARDLINAKIKFREKFRPFAPSIQEEHVADWFDPAEPSPFMERVLPIRPEKRAQIPAVTHVDGTGRLQTVSRAANLDYWRVIEAFRQRTGVPMVLNTSLNENEPIVRAPAEALDCFLRTQMDAIAMGPYLVERK
jgi:carbamoyltransferase